MAMTGTEPLVLETLIRRGKIEPSVVDEARQAIAKSAGSQERALVRAGLVEDRTISEAYVDEFLLTPLDPSQEDDPVDRDLLLEMLPEKLCTDRLIVPVRVVRDDTLEVAFVSPEETGPGRGTSTPDRLPNPPPAGAVGRGRGEAACLVQGGSSR